MKKRILAYLDYIDKLLDESDKNPEVDRNWDKEIEHHLTQIAFFQHERLIHLIVTVTFALLALIGITAALATPQIPLLILVMLFIVLLVPYVRHYYILENGVQELYRRYDTIVTHIPTEKI